jgi:hypothetical protein
MYFLGDLKGWSGQGALWGFVERGALRIHFPADTETRRMRVLMEKYIDTRMDLADASLSLPLKRSDSIASLHWTVIFGYTVLTHEQV